MSVWVCLLIHGAPAYYAAGRETALSFLAHSDFQIALIHDGGDLALPPHPRLHRIALPPTEPDLERAGPFLHKFKALALTLRQCAPDYLILLDADTVLVRQTSEPDVAQALGSASLAMVEQTTVTGSKMSRPDFLEHYRQHSLAVIAPGTPPPALANFRYFNSGVVLGRKAEWEALTQWALTIIPTVKTHRVGQHMVADQDYFQYWALQQHPGCCQQLPGSWNHCAHWDRGFPRLGVRIAHFSNFCNGPLAETPARMRALWQGQGGFFHRHVGRFIPWK